LASAPSPTSAAAAAPILNSAAPPPERSSGSPRSQPTSPRSSALPRSTQNTPQPYVPDGRVHEPQQSTKKPAQRAATPTSATATPSPAAHARRRRFRCVHAGGCAGHTSPTRVQQLVARGPEAKTRRRPLRLHHCLIQWHEQESQKRQWKRQKSGIANALFQCLRFSVAAIPHARGGSSADGKQCRRAPRALQWLFPSSNAIPTLLSSPQKHTERDTSVRTRWRSTCTSAVNQKASSARGHADRPRTNPPLIVHGLRAHCDVS